MEVGVVEFLDGVQVPCHRLLVHVGPFGEDAYWRLLGLFSDVILIVGVEVFQLLILVVLLRFVTFCSNLSQSYLLDYIFLPLFPRN